MGSLIAALASFLDARHHGGTWLLRMEDLDPPREVAGAAESIIESLQAHDLLWDEAPVRQSQRGAAYDRALADLNARQQLFYCDCTRAMLGPEGTCNGRCAGRQHALRPPTACRLHVESSAKIDFHDRLLGPITTALGAELSDFILKRKDGLYAYQLAVVVDDAAAAVSHIVRGSDLLSCTARQIYLQQQLGAATPTYLHIPVITNEQGQKFSKQNHAPALDDNASGQNLRQALRFLNQATPPATALSNSAILAFAIEHWCVASIPATTSIPANSVAS